MLAAGIGASFGYPLVSGVLSASDPQPSSPRQSASPSQSSSARQPASPSQSASTAERAATTTTSTPQPSIARSSARDSRLVADEPEVIDPTADSVSASDDESLRDALQVLLAEHASPEPSAAPSATPLLSPAPASDRIHNVTPTQPTTHVPSPTEAPAGQ